MRKMRAVVAGVLAALWVVVSSHCLLEEVAAFSFLSCAAACAGESTPASHCDDAACQVLESGQYVTSVQPKPPVVAPGIMVLDLTVAAETRTPPELSAGVLTGAPPGLPKTWQFLLRAALPPRAPSLIA
jgi:hypothetical protein